MNATDTKRRNPGGPGRSSARGGTARARKADRGRGPSRLSLALSWLRRKLSRAASWLRTQIKARVARSLSRAAGWLRARIRPVMRMVKSRAAAAIGTDHGFGFWWLVSMAAIAFTIGLIVTVLLSPVIGIVAALVAAIWMLVRRNRSARSQARASLGQTA